MSKYSQERKLPTLDNSLGQYACSPIIEVLGLQSILPLYISQVQSPTEGRNWANERECSIQPSSPYNATAFALSNQDVTPYEGNTSTFYIPAEDEVWSGKFARLVVEGCWEEDGEGSTVGEFVLAS
jgi:hypothetical protein